jgi:hypothetical protein
MIAVLICALAFTAEVIRRKREFYRERERYHARMAENERRSSRMAEDRLRNPINETENGMFRYIARTRAERAEWHEALRKKWQRGISHPWERVERDPPTPDNYGSIDFDRPVYPPPSQAASSSPVTHAK